MKMNIYHTTCIIVVLVMSLAGCAMPVEQFATPTPFADSDELFTVTWARPLALDDLVWGADLIVEGTIAGIQEARLEHQETGIPGMVYTDYKVDVAKILKSPSAFTDRSVVIKHRGGTYQGKTQINVDDVPYQAGDKVLLFLVDISMFPGQTRPGETKYSVMMPGGRFHLKPDGKLDTPTKNLAVADTYRGKDMSALEKDVLARLPTTFDYVQKEVETSFLVVEGRVGPLQKTYMSMEGVTPEQLAELKTRGLLPELVYTFYSFSVDKVLKDELVYAQGYPHKTGLYKGTPVKAGDVITVLEMGGTFEGITQRRTLVPFLKPGDKMLLFLGAIGCGDHLSICTQVEQNANKVLYRLGDGGGRFLIGADNRLTTTSFGSISRFYTGQPINKLEQDLATAKANLEKAREAQKKQPTSVPSPFPPPTAAPRP